MVLRRTRRRRPSAPLAAAFTCTLAVTTGALLSSPAHAQTPDSSPPGTSITAITAITATSSATSSSGTSGLTSVTVDLSSYRNGALATDQLCSLSFAAGQLLQCDAAAALEKLDVAYRAAFGTDLQITDSYRSFDAQVAAHVTKPTLTADPGYSNHGWGLAIDVAGGGETFGTAQHAWLVEHAPEYGWGHPTWAAATGSKPEAWHFEFGTGTTMEGPTSAYVVTVDLGTSGPPAGWVDPTTETAATTVTTETTTSSGTSRKKHKSSTSSSKAASQATASPSTSPSSSPSAGTGGSSADSGGDTSASASPSTTATPSATATASATPSASETGTADPE